MNRTEQAEIEAIKQGCVVLIMGALSVALVCWIVVTGQLQPTYSEQDLEDARITSYEAGYMEASRNCLKSYNETWGGNDESL